VQTELRLKGVKRRYLNYGR